MAVLPLSVAQMLVHLRAHITVPITQGEFETIFRALKKAVIERADDGPVDIKMPRDLEGSY